MATITAAAAALRRISRNEPFKSFVLSTPGLHDLLLKAVARFIGGETLDECLTTARALQTRGFALAIDYMGESTRNVHDARSTIGEFLKAVEALQPQAGELFLSPDLSHLGMLVDPGLAQQGVLQLAKAVAVSAGEVIINMEGSDRTQQILDIHKELCRSVANVGITLQAYLHRTPTDLTEALNHPGRIRLVKGAYEEPDTAALAWGRPTDTAFSSFMEKLILSGHPILLATHDPALLDHAVTFIGGKKLSQRLRERIEFEMNYGIAEDRLAQLRDLGFKTRVYLPYGTEWFLYLCHRLAEFPSNIYRGVVDIAQTV